MDVEVAVQKSALACPLLFRCTPESSEAHVDHARTPPLPFKSARGVSLNVAGPRDLGICPYRCLPKIEKTRPGETGILGAFALFDEIAPCVAISPTPRHLNDLATFQFDPDLREGAGKMARGACDYAGSIFFCDQGRHGMAEEVAVAGSRRKAVTAPVVIFLPIGPRDIRPFGVRKSRSPTTSLFPDRLPCFLVDEKVELERISS